MKKRQSGAPPSAHILVFYDGGVEAACETIAVNWPAIPFR
jgi:hypothetical protein